MKVELKGALTFIKEYALITLGILMYVTGWDVFLIPNNLIGGGVTGLGSIIQYATGGFVKVGYTYFAVNVILLLLALKTLGKGFSGKTIFAIVIASVGLTALQSIIPEDIIKTLAIDNGKLMSTIMGAVFSGVGIGLCMSQGGSTGGTDIVALVVNKYRGTSPGKMILWLDVFIILSSFLVPSYTADGTLMPWTEKLTTVIYAFVLTTINSTVLDLYLSGAKQSVQLFILSKKYAQIADTITHDLHRGVTVLDGKGWYTKQNTEVLMVLTRKSDLNILLKYIKTIDPHAFLSVASVTGVYGQGFETIKFASPKKQAENKLPEQQ
ncbi:MAG: YitT family protein [Bacteroidales bacterium]|nr:YitT family protein [Bacteroidales bacterium]